MSRIEWTPVGGARGAAEVNAIFDAIATQSGAVDASVLQRESLDATVIEDRPVWYRLDTLAKTVRNAATLPVTGGTWTNLDHRGAGGVGTGLLRFNFSVFPLAANEALRFGSWLSWETTQSAGLGVVGLVQLRWAYGGSALPGSLGRIQRNLTPTNPIQQHGQAFIEGWLEGPQTVNGFVEVQYLYTGAQAYLDRSLTFVDLYRQWES